MDNPKQYYIYIRSTKEKVTVTKEEFDAYYHDIDNYRRKQQRRGQCVCPQSKQLECDMDCLTCPFRRAGNICSTDDAINGTDISYLETLYDDSLLIDDMIADSTELELLFERLQELMPQAVEIGKLRLLGHTDVSIAKQLGMGNTTMFYRLKRAKKILSKEFPDLF